VLIEALADPPKDEESVPGRRRITVESIPFVT
jgi:hypothetical protein